MKLIDGPNDIPTGVSYSHFNCFECRKRIIISKGLYTECPHYPFNPTK